MRVIFIVALSFLMAFSTLNKAFGEDAGDLQSIGVGHVHMDISCSPAVSRNFDIALALLHNFWYPRALSTFKQVIDADPECAMGYWGAAMTYNHPVLGCANESGRTKCLGASAKSREGEREVTP